MLDRLYVKTVEWLVILALVAMVGIGFASTVLRGVPGWGGLYWAEEIIRYACIWMVFLAAGLGVRYGVHLHVDFLTSKLPRGVQRVLRVLVCLFMLVFEGVLLYYGILVVIDTSEQQSTSLQFPMSYVYAAIPVGAAMMIFETLRILAATLAGRDGAGLAEHHVSVKVD